MVIIAKPDSHDMVGNSEMVLPLKAFTNQAYILRAGYADDITTLLLT